MSRSIEPTMHLRALGHLAAAPAHGSERVRAPDDRNGTTELGAALHKPRDCKFAVIISVAMQDDLQSPFFTPNCWVRQRRFGQRR
jgi:hypothetical protein